jgi:6-phosphogluconate dehydrogenase
MKIAMIGLGKMGANMTPRLIEHGHEVVAFDLSEEARTAAVGVGADPASTLEEVATKLSAPRVAWVMVPAGEPTNSTITTLAGPLRWSSSSPPRASPWSTPEPRVGSGD